MGTQEQKDRRQNYLQKAQSIFDAASRGDWADNDSLKAYLQSIGAAPDKALFNQFNSEGGYSRYGGSWDPGWKFDFNTGEKIPHMGEGETWYDPSVAENWQKTPELQANRMHGHFDWADKNADMINSRFGGNAFAANQRLKALSNMPNVLDMSWWNEGNKGVTAPPTATPTPTGPNTSTPVTQPNTGQVMNASALVNPAFNGMTNNVYGSPQSPNIPQPVPRTSPNVRRAKMGNRYGTNPFSTANTPSSTSTRTTSAPWYSTWKY